MTSDGEFPDSDLDVEGEDAPWVDDLPDDDVDSAQDVLVAAARAAGARMVVMGNLHFIDNLKWRRIFYLWNRMLPRWRIEGCSSRSSVDVVDWVDQLPEVLNGVLVDRSRTDRTVDPIETMAAVLDAGQSLILFPEGTRGHADHRVVFFDLLARSDAARGNLVPGGHLGARAQAQLWNVLAQGQGGFGHQHVVVGVQVQQGGIGAGHGVFVVFG
mgnify:CR=1 FL=1